MHMATWQMRKMSSQLTSNKIDLLFIPIWCLQKIYQKNEINSFTIFFDLWSYKWKSTVFLYDYYDYVALSLEQARSFNTSY